MLIVNKQHCKRQSNLRHLLSFLRPRGNFELVSQTTEGFGIPWKTLLVTEEGDRGEEMPRVLLVSHNVLHQVLVPNYTILPMGRCHK